MAMTETETKLCEVLEKLQLNVNIINYYHKVVLSIEEAKKILKKVPEDEKEIYINIFSKISQKCLWDVFETSLRDEECWNTFFYGLWYENDSYYKGKFLKIDNDVDVGSENPQGDKILIKNGD